MAKIRELKFNVHPSGLEGKQAIVEFPNGYKASVVTGDIFYSRPGCPYEIAVLNKEGRLDYSTPVTDDVCGYLTEEEANEILAQIEALPAN